MRELDELLVRYLEQCYPDDDEDDKAAFCQVLELSDPEYNDKRPHRNPSRVSSNAYCAELRPDPSLRRIVCYTGIALVAAGLLAIVHLPGPAVLRVAIALGWCAWCWRELVRLRRAWSVCEALRIDAAGDVAIMCPDRDWAPARLLPGSVLLRRAAWIRIEAADGSVFAEPLRGTCRKCHDWRRLQIIWRHIGASR
jgi:hypothetical protein